MRVTVIKGEFSGQFVDYLASLNADSVCVSIDGNFAILPLSWIEASQTCHRFKSPTKSMRLPAHLEGRLRAAAIAWEQEESTPVTEQKTASKPVRKRTVRTKKKSRVTKSKQAI